jgi:hypothetical protein
MMKLSIAVTALVLLLTPSCLTATQRDDGAAPKPPWQWSDDERLAVRFDPVSMAERRSPEVLAQYGFKPPTTPRAVSQSTKGAGGPITFVILGERNPELFMPFELFDFLIETALQEDTNVRVSWQKIFAENAGAPLPSDFWNRLERAAKPYLDAQRALSAKNREWKAASEAQRNAMAPSFAGLQDRLCGARAEALTAARNEFGTTVLYRVLYERAAPGLHQWSSDPLPAEKLRAIEGGCK